MIKEKAVEIIKQLLKDEEEQGDIFFTDEDKDALKLAIKTLSAPAVPQDECRTCRHRDPEDKKCDCGALERAGCPFPVSDDYFCKFYEKGGAENG